MSELVVQGPAPEIAMDNNSTLFKGHDLPSTLAGLPFGQKTSQTNDQCCTRRISPHCLKTWTI
jgi:hypothetical protein